MPIIRCGYKVTRNEAEEEAFTKFMARIEEKGEIFGDTRVDDVMIMRFLRARALDLDRAEEMFLKALDFREENRVNFILDEWKPQKKEINIYITGGLHKYDKDGDPVRVDRLGQIDVGGVLKAFGEEEITKFGICINEKMDKTFLEETEKQGRLVERMTIIMDLSGLSRKHLYAPGLMVFKKLSHIGEDNYPERLKRCFIVNAPAIFPRIWGMVKGFFDPRTQKKISILGSNYYEELCEYIPEENIPAFLGGKSQIGDDPFCKDDIAPGGTVPAHLYQNAACDEEEEEKTVQIKAGQSHIHSFTSFEGQIFKWDYNIQTYDVDFEFYFFDDRTGEKKNIKEKERIKGDDGPSIKGEYRCHTTGTYVFKWDNSFSWTRSKTITYKVERHDPPSMMEFDHK